MHIQMIDRKTYGVLNMFNQLVKSFESHDDAFDYLKEIEY